jgi:hypothetical protein
LAACERYDPVPFTELSSMVPDWDAGKAPDIVCCGTA